MTAKRARKIHLSGMVFWLANGVIFYFLPPGWRIPYLGYVSIYANFVGHWSGYSAERPTEVESPNRKDSP